MAKIRVGIIGLGTNADIMTPGSWGYIAHFKSLQALADYEIVAVANSSIDSARKSIEHHGLPASTKAYGTPEDIADDPNVELVVISVAVKKHFYLTKPALEKKKSVFVEWPLGASVAEAEALTELATANNVKTLVGLQVRMDPVFQKLKATLESKEIGNVVSSIALVSTSNIPADTGIKGAEYYLDFKSGGNEFTILFGHFLDTYTHVLGDFLDVQGLLKSQHTAVPVIDPSNGQMVDPNYPKSSPDHIFVQGTLINGALASISFRKPRSAADNVQLRWIITGTGGEMILTVPEGQWQFGSSDSWSIVLKKGKGSDFREIMLTDLDKSPASSVPMPGTNTARLYQSFANGSYLGATFEAAAKNHRLLNRIANSAGWEL